MSDAVLIVSAKCDDLITVELQGYGEGTLTREGEIAPFLGRRSGYILLKIDPETGQIKNWPGLDAVVEFLSDAEDSTADDFQEAQDAVSAIMSEPEPEKLTGIVPRAADVDDYLENAVLEGVHPILVTYLTVFKFRFKEAPLQAWNDVGLILTGNLGVDTAALQELLSEVIDEGLAREIAGFVELSRQLPNTVDILMGTHEGQPSMNSAYGQSLMTILLYALHDRKKVLSADELREQTMNALNFLKANSNPEILLMAMKRGALLGLPVEGMIPSFKGYVTGEWMDKPTS